MSANVMLILAMILEALPHAIRGVEAAVRLVDAGSKLFTQVVNEGRDPTDDEIQAVRALRQASYDDFYTDDEAVAGDPAPTDPPAEPTT